MFADSPAPPSHSWIAMTSSLRVVVVDMKETLHVGEWAHVHKEHDSVERERSHDGDGQATPEGPVAAFSVDVSGVRPPRLAARRRERVRLHPGFDRVERHVVPRGHARDTAGKQHDACKESAVIVNVRYSTVFCPHESSGRSVNIPSFPFCFQICERKAKNEFPFRFQKWSKKYEKLIRFSFANFKAKKEKTIWYIHWPRQPTGQ